MQWTRYSSLLTVGLVVLVACGKPEVDFTRLSVGMDKDQVIKLMGKPTRVAVHEGVEFFEYEAFDSPAAGPNFGRKLNYRVQYVKLTNGRVESFGTKGDFGTTKNPTTEQKIDLKITGGTGTGTSAANTAEKFDLVAELKKLDQLKKEGLLTEDEFKQLRQRAIDKAKAQ